MGWTNSLAILATLGLMSCADTTGPNRVEEVELSDVKFADGTTIPVCTETSVKTSQPGYIILSDMPTNDINLFEALNTPDGERSRLRDKRTDGSFWYGFAKNSERDFKTASVRSNLARCNFVIPAELDQSTLFTSVFGSPSSLSYELYHRDDAVEYIVVRRKERRERDGRGD